jgi:calcium-dependent protein kinase
MGGKSRLGEVRKCYHKIAKTKRAVKILNKDDMTARDKRRLEAELKLQQELDHPHILKLYEVYEDPAHTYIVQELCTGGELYDEVVHRQRFTEQ